MTDDQMHPARAAATLVIFRDRSGEAAELLMMERSRAMDFAGGALVFPGGAVDADDTGPAGLFGHGLELDEAAARVAAVRETLEECGLALGFSGGLDPALAAALRARLAKGEAFAALLAEYGLGLDLQQLVPFARWLPNVKHKRNYDTRFYLARVADDSHEPCVDATENVSLFWASARDVLARADRGEAQLIFPTRRNLERLAQFSDFASARAHARSIALRTITPWVEERAGDQHLCIPDDQGYPVTSESLATAFRAL
jgi:8-oxo-dGTP pyrophosphatase MutT (NUDIX family)